MRDSYTEIYAGNADLAILGGIVAFGAIGVNLFFQRVLIARRARSQVDADLSENGSDAEESRWEWEGAVDPATSLGQFPLTLLQPQARQASK